MSNELKLELDQNGKYVIIVRHENGKHIEDLSQLASQLWDWFHSDDKYMIMPSCQTEKILQMRVWIYMLGLMIIIGWQLSILIALLLFILEFL